MPCSAPAWVRPRQSHELARRGAGGRARVCPSVSSYSVPRLQCPSVSPSLCPVWLSAVRVTRRESGLAFVNSRERTSMGGPATRTCTRTRRVPTSAAPTARRWVRLLPAAWACRPRPPATAARRSNTCRKPAPPSPRAAPFRMFQQPAADLYLPIFNRLYITYLYAAL